MEHKGTKRVQYFSRIKEFSSTLEKKRKEFVRRAVPQIGTRFRNFVFSEHLHVYACVPCTRRTNVTAHRRAYSRTKISARVYRGRVESRHWKFRTGTGVSIHSRRLPVALVSSPARKDDKIANVAVGRAGRSCERWCGSTAQCHAVGGRRREVGKINFADHAGNFPTPSHRARPPNGIDERRRVGGGPGDGARRAGRGVSYDDKTVMTSRPALGGPAFRRRDPYESTAR